MKRVLGVICLVLGISLMFACDETKKMMSPVIDEIVDTDTEGPIDETEAEGEPESEGETEGPTIDVDFSDIESPPKGTVPEGVVILDTDRVFHFIKEDWDNREDFDGDNFYRGGVFDTAEEASNTDAVIAYFEIVKSWVEENCGRNWQSLEPILIIEFTTRAERQKFKDALPGGYIDDGSGEDKWWSTWQSVAIVDSTDVYFSLSVDPNEPCDNFID